MSNSTDDVADNDPGLSEAQLSEISWIFQEVAAGNGVTNTAENSSLAKLTCSNSITPLLKHIRILAIENNLLDWSFAVGENDNQLVITASDNNSLVEGAKSVLKAREVQDKPRTSIALRIQYTPAEQIAIRKKHGIENPALRKSAKIVRAVAANCLSDGITEIEGGYVAACKIMAMENVASLQKVMELALDGISAMYDLRFTIKDGCIFIGATDKNALVAGLQSLAGVRTIKPDPTNPPSSRNR